MHANHATITIQGWSPPLLFPFWTLYSQCDGMQCSKLDIAYNRLWNGTRHNTQCLHYTMKGLMHWRWYMWGHVPQTHPPFGPYWLRQIRQVVPSYVKAWSVGQKNSLCPCVGWVNLYSHFKCKWLGQSIILFPLPCLCRSSKNNLVILGQDVRPCAQNAQSS